MYDALVLLIAEPHDIDNLLQYLGLIHAFAFSDDHGSPSAYF